MKANDTDVWEAMSADLATELQAAQGYVERERKALARAVARYGRARAEHGEPPFESFVHFFAVDGAAIDVTVKPALHRPKSDDATFARWTATLENLPQRLDQLDEIADGGARARRHRARW